MTLGIWLTIAAIFVLIILSAFFSGSETALTAVSRARLHLLVKEGSKRALIAQSLIEMRERLIGALLLGNNLVNILASALATSLFISLFGDTGVIYATVVMTVLVLVFAEVLPKTWAITQPEKFAIAVAPVVRFVVTVFAPIVISVQWLVRVVLRLFGVNVAKEDGPSGHEELRGAVDVLHKDGEVIKDDRDMFGGLLDLKEMEVSDVMVHRTKMFALDVDEPTDKVLTQALDSPFSRIPIYRDEPDNIIGILHMKDLLRAMHKAKGKTDKLNLAKIAKKTWFVPETTPLQGQLNSFLKNKSHFAIVVDEYGEVEGLLTLEDILEEIVGEIADEHDIEFAGIETQPDGSLIVEGALPIRDLNRSMGWDLPDEEATTIAGLVLHEAKTIPSRGQTFTFYDLRFTILKREQNRLTSLKIAKKKLAQ